MTRGCDGLRPLLGLLGDRNPRVRSFALRRLGEGAGLDVVPELRRAGVDRDPIVAFEAATALRRVLARSRQARRDESPVEPELRRAGLVLLEPSRRALGLLVSRGGTGAARAAAAALGKMGDPSAVPGLAEGLRRDDVSADCAMALAGIGGGECCELLLDRLESRDEAQVQHALFAAGTFEDRRVAPALRRLLAHPAPLVRADALLVLGTAGTDDDAPAVAALADDPDERVALKALEALARLSPSRFVEEVRVRFPRSGDRVRATQVALLAEVPLDPVCLDILERALDDQDSRVRANAVEVLGEAGLSAARLDGLLARVRGDRNNRVLGNLAVALAPVDVVSSLEILSRLLGSGDKWERASAVFAAGFIAEERVAGWLANLFVLEEDVDVLENAVSSLARIGDDGVVERMTGCLRHHDVRVRRGAAQVLGLLARRGVRRSAVREALAALLEEERSAEVQEAALQGLAGLVDASRIALVGQFLHGRPSAVQAAAVHALDSVGTVEILPVVEPSLFSADPAVKAAAAVALWKQGHLDVIHVLTQMLEGEVEEDEAASAAFAVGEIGLTLFRLNDFGSCYLLISALAARSRQAGGGAPRVVDDVPSDAELGLLRCLPAIDSLGRGMVREAVAVLRGLVAETPADGRIHFLLGRAYRRLEQPERALDHLSLAAGRLPGFLNVHLELASLLHEGGDPPGALRAFMEAARIRATIVERLAGFVDVLLAADRVREASLTVRTVVESFAFDAALHGAVGRHLAAMGEEPEAFEHLALSLLAGPDVPAARAAADLAGRRGRHDLVEALGGLVTRGHEHGGPLSP